MRKGVLLSVLLHFLIVLFLAFNVSGFLVPEPEVTYINVQLVSDPNAAQSAKPKKVTPVKSQQSAAPKAPIQKKRKAKKDTSKKTKVVDTSKKSLKKAKKKLKQKEKPKKQQAAPRVEEEPIGRPPLLDKTPDKKPILKAKDTSKTVEKDNFLEALGFIDDIEDKKPALTEGPKNTTAIYDETQKEVAFLKRHIEKNWYRPPGIEALERMQVVVQLEVNRDGTVKRMEVIKSSGRRFFDNSILRAVRKSVPLPIPEGAYDIFKTIQISFNR